MNCMSIYYCMTTCTWCMHKKKCPFYHSSFQNNLLNSPHIWIQSSPGMQHHSTFSFHLCLSCVAALSLPSFLSITCPETRGTQALEADEDNRVSVLIEVVVVVGGGGGGGGSLRRNICGQPNRWGCIWQSGAGLLKDRSARCYPGTLFRCQSHPRWQCYLSPSLQYQVSFRCSELDVTPWRRSINLWCVFAGIKCVCVCVGTFS